MTEFYSCHNTEKKVYMVLGYTLNIRDVCKHFEPCFKVYNLVSVHPKNLKLGQMT